MGERGRHLGGNKGADGGGRVTDPWDIFDALTCDHPALADLEMWMLPKFSDADILRWYPSLERARAMKERKLQEDTQ